MREAAPELGVSDDTLLGGRVRLRQPRRGYRVAVDPVLLAAAVPAGPGDTVLDIGCGVGAAMLCLASRVAQARVTGIDPQRDLVRLANDNAAANDLSARVVAVVGNLLRPPPRLEPGSFAHVMANPPFLAGDAATVSPDPGKAAATVEGEADLAAWVGFALAMTRPKGSLTFIHRADRMEQLLAELSGRAGEIVVFPLWAGRDKAAKRIIVRARKGVATPTRLTPGLVLHEDDGRYTTKADAVLRGGAALALNPS
jgi:tRNA1(Val) A37 N6-methylase TrmN6